jgi:alpha-tubulin suppressor-like RCC1 family protein
VSVPGSIVTVDAGRQHTCTLNSDGDVHCWGADNRMQSGGTSTVVCGGNARNCLMTPTLVADTPADITELAVGGDHTCVLSNGTVLCWGDNYYDQLGPDVQDDFTATLTVIPLPGLTIDLAASDMHSCALLDTGELYCWGAAGQGRLGTPSAESQATPTLVPLPGPVTSFALGVSHGCAVVDEQLHCWGENNKGQVDPNELCDGDSCVLSPRPIPFIDGALTYLAAGTEHTCVTMDGGLHCWGSDETGQLGGGFRRTATAPVESSIAGPLDDAVFCTGNNHEYQLGHTSGSYSNAWTRVSLANDAIATGLMAGDDHTCALADGRMQCWGDNANGRLGRGFAGPDQADADWTMLPGSTLTAGTNGATACAVIDEGSGPEARCWGYGYNGSLGNGSDDSSYTPVVPVGLTGSAITRIDGMDQRHCALMDGAVYCWGLNYRSRLGVGLSTSESDNCKGEPCLRTPTQVVGLDSSQNITMLAVGSEHICAARADRIWCWGENELGQIDPQSSDSTKSTPTVISGVPTPVDALHAGRNHTCALSGGQIYCWGDDSLSQLGQGEPLFGGRTATLVPGLDNIIDLSLGDGHSCAIQDRTGDGRGDALLCWGWDSRSQLGIGSRPEHVLASPPCAPAPVQDL